MEIKNNYKSPLLLKNISITEALLKINPTPKEDNGQLNLSVSKNIKKITDNIFNILVKTSLSSDNKDIDISVTCSSTFEVSEDIEKEIGISVFIRSRTGITLTKEGMEFLGYARQVIQKMELLEDRYVTSKSEKIKFGVSAQHYTFTENAFVELVKCFGHDR